MFPSQHLPLNKQTKKQQRHFPYPQKEYKPYFQDKLSLDISYVTLCFSQSKRIKLPAEVTIFTLYADKQLIEQNSSVFPKLFVLSIISAEDLKDLHSVQGVILADFCGNRKAGHSFEVYYFY